MPLLYCLPKQDNKKQRKARMKLMRNITGSARVTSSLASHAQAPNTTRNKSHVLPSMVSIPK